jgi:hypothetical protein
MPEMLHARCDESYPGGDPKTAPVYVVAGLLGTADQWRLFDDLWRRDMRMLNITDVGLHASKCAVGAKPYDHLDSNARYEIQYRMIVDIAAARLYGCAAVSDQAYYVPRRELFNSFLGAKSRRFNEPHVITTRQCINLMLLATEEKTTEPIAMIVDRNSAFGGRVEEWYRMDLANEGLDAADLMGGLYRSRLGGLKQDSRLNVLGLQAADLLAYTSLRRALHERSLGKLPWQWSDLSSGIRIRYFTFGEDYWQEIEDALRKNAGATAAGTGA